MPHSTSPITMVAKVPTASLNEKRADADRATAKR